MLGDLKDFLLRGNVLDLAVAVIIGAAFSAIVNAFAMDVLLGTIAAVFGQPEINFALGPVDFSSLIAAVINFLIVGTALFFVVRALARLQRPGPEEADTEVPDPQDIVLLREIRDLLAARSKVGDAATSPPASPPPRGAAGP